ncbi:MAG: protein kinase, partial [Coxiellaceae bacterium]|nr:protein kinase [Coxiellaceae bacterium]
QIGRQLYVGYAASMYYLAGEYLGKELFGLISNAKGKPKHLLFFIRLFMRIASQVAKLNATGVVHFDLKPENILLRDPDNWKHPRLIDFGLSKQLNAKSSHGMGTPEYVAPELVLAGLKDVEYTADFRSDTFSLAVTFLSLFYMILFRSVLSDTVLDLSDFDKFYDKRLNDPNEFDIVFSEINKKIPKDQREDFLGLVIILRAALDKTQANRLSTEDFYNALCDLRFKMEVKLYEQDPRALAFLYQHGIKSENFHKRQAVENAFNDNLRAKLVYSQSVFCVSSPKKRKRQIKPSDNKENTNATGESRAEKTLKK